MAPVSEVTFQAFWGQNVAMELIIPDVKEVSGYLEENGHQLDHL